MDIEIQDPIKEEEEQNDAAASSPENEAEETAQVSREEPESAEDLELVEEEETASEVDSDPPSDLEDEVLKWRNLALRNQADLENYRKRMVREKSEAVQYANITLLRSLLPILDNFQMGLQAAKAEGDDSIIYQGMVMVWKQIEEFVAEEGVETVDAVGAEFDPNLHEAVQQEWSDEEPEGTIIGELRRGYRLGERLLRPANVVVSKGPEAEADVENEESGAEGDE